MSIARGLARISRLGVPCLVAALMVCGASEATMGADVQKPAESNGPLNVLEIKPNFYMIAGAGSNVTVHIGRDGVVVTDAGRAGAVEALLGAIRRLTSQPIRFVINTSADPDHVGGNAVLSAAGESIHPGGTRRFGIIDPR
jgi:cyclase